jgi:hypothetical protein
MTYPVEIEVIAQVLLKEIENFFPGLTKQKFDGAGYPNEKGSSAQQRAEFCIYIELMKAGAFNAAIQKTKSNT